MINRRLVEKVHLWRPIRCEEYDVARKRPSHLRDRYTPPPLYAHKVEVVEDRRQVHPVRKVSGIDFDYIGRIIVYCIILLMGRINDTIHCTSSQIVG